MLTSDLTGSHAPAAVRDRTTVYSEMQAPPSTPLPPRKSISEPPHQGRTNNAFVLEDTSRTRASGSRTTPPRSLSLVEAGFCLAVCAILAAPINTGVFAAPCTSGTTTTSAGVGGGGNSQQVGVTPATNLDLTSFFDCEGGDFDVYWSGTVNIAGTIVIGSGTTVRIFGDGNYSESPRSLDNRDGFEELTTGLELPHGLTSEAVGIGSPDMASGADTSVSFGPMFYVNGGHLVLEDLIVRGGFTANTTNGLDGRGGGVQAIQSIVSVARCEFSDNFAEHWGGGIFTNQSTLEVVDSVFRSCEAGFPSAVEDEDLEGTGGGIWVSGFLFVVIVVVLCSPHRCHSCPARVACSTCVTFVVVAVRMVSL